MTNTEKAYEIARFNREFYGEGGASHKYSDEECYDSAMDMAKWKDEQYKKREEGLQETINMLDVKLQEANKYGLYYFDQYNIQKQQNQYLIDNVCEWLKNNIHDYYMTCEFEQWFDEMYVDLKKEMKK